MIYRRILIMKLVFFMTFILTFQAFAVSKAQKVSLNVRNAPLSEVLHKIQEQSGVSFFFRGVDIASTQVSANVHQKDLNDVLDRILMGKSLDWQIEDGIIIIAPSPAPRVTSNISAQNIEISGVVRDESNNVL